MRRRGQRGRRMVAAAAVAVSGGLTFGASTQAANPPAVPAAAAAAPSISDEEQDLQTLQHLRRRGLRLADLAAPASAAEVASPAQALRALQVGNARFFSDQYQTPDLSPKRRRALSGAQNPFAVILGCADSRVPLEHVFDQGMGDLFGIRVAGNIAEPATIGSIQYAVRHLRPYLVVVLGHQHCGAVKAALSSREARLREPACIVSLLDQIVPAVQNVAAVPGDEPGAHVGRAVVENVRWQVGLLRRDPVIAEAEVHGRLRVVGAYYDMDSGAVEFLDGAAPSPPHIPRVVAPTAAAAPIAAPRQTAARKK